MFIPDQDEGGLNKPDWNCNNDAAFGCWTPQFAVIDHDWTEYTMPANLPWDYAFVVVSDVGSHVGGSDSNANIALDNTVPALDVSFNEPIVGGRTTALGYSSDPNPDLRYCAQYLEIEANMGGYLLNGCALSDGAIGGP